ncbi:NBR1-Ig-like domain-containing protein [Nonomuraea sp. NPDC049419]|uniref:NBR1-Ig-like domain-containing protein n=1 Tax=Nonomuraea sp. NPDC049419 TaxID=3155772 RepID=UPI003442C6F1
MAQSSGRQDEGTGTRRGRRPIRPDPASGPVALFAHRLWQLKEEAGDPSFADMATKLGAAASKSSLAAAARGTSLPSWETTWEFVRVLAVDRLGHDEEETRRKWRTHWEQATTPPEPTRTTDTTPASPDDTPRDAAPPEHTHPGDHARNTAPHLSATDDRAQDTAPHQRDTDDHAQDTAPHQRNTDEAAPTPSDSVAAGPGTSSPSGLSDSGGPAGGPGDSGAELGASSPSGLPGAIGPAGVSSGSARGEPGASYAEPVVAGRRRRVAIVTVVAAAVGVVAVLAGWLWPVVTDDGPPRTTPHAQPSPAPTSTPAASPHDDSVFERDVTYPDGSVVRAGERFDKTWRIRNSGGVHWHDRYLTRMNDTPCKAPKRVGIGPVRPGESVDITVRVKAAESPGRCKVYWKMTDKDGTPLMAGKRPIFLDVTVA